MAARPVSAEERTNRPNIIIIIADDLGYGDLGCFGCPDISTPNIDRLAERGVRFTDAHSYPVCSPTRASLMSGRYAENVGITTALTGKSVPEFGKATIMAKILRDAGYHTGLVGKWHLGYGGEVLPTMMGFDEYFGHLGGKIDYFKHTDATQNDAHDLWEGETEVTREGYATDLFTERACAFIKDNSDKPFCLYLAYNAPHYPTRKGVYQAPESYLKQYGVTGRPDNQRGGYGAMVTCMDDGVGRVLSTLRETGIDKKTLVLFMSDNGAEEKGSNAPLSGGKHTTKEGGIRVPWIACWPGTIPEHTVSKQTVHVIDILPTMLGVAGIEPPAGLQLDGINVWPAFTGRGSLPERTLYFGHDTVRKGRWKYIKGELYDLDADLAEKNDVSGQHPEIVRELDDLLRTKP
ncbi:MAG: sulfatase-like hydrolase/transferase [Kiritimatiellae bacterium]|nr:sulfatase-like hydrolase/transferase [Kiritimatiellia bacterium]